ncbi:uncharacterized protein BCR38DRAFT_509939 [Pseudomassariella vexata]|uniref:Uncharacterized protein n=1 Tax=Pseudomassariella vexata TaxID=1141098 RepID=A0A1Y2E6L9_9PEZI|nr:uncharacterized protein BCR38DRAFT_509939 [Pseudomassariella vexata]ORY67223.1 hypothetical protein BCR38DRAFT_509939 [Pseudomassariella vexata]
MGSSQATSSHLSLPYHWDPEFSTRRNLRYQDQNKPYVVWQRDINPGLNTIALFMNHDDSDPCPYQANSKVFNFCPAARCVEAFRSGGNDLKKPIALLSDSESTLKSRHYKKALTAEELYEALNKPWSVLALAATANNHEAYVLRDFIYHHLAFSAMIRVELPSEGLSTFALCFHLPFYALRNCKRADKRKWPDQQPLRQVEDVSFVKSPAGNNLNSAPKQDHLHEAQISCVVTGWDETVWEAYFFIDLYYDEETAENIEDYEGQMKQLPEQLDADPLMKGTFVGSARSCVRKPREYFLNILRVRVRQVKKEWRYVVTRMEEDIKVGKRFYSPCSQLDGQVRPIRFDAKDARSTRKKFLHWTDKVIELLRKLIEKLDETVEAREKFNAGSIGYFYAPGASTNISKTDHKTLICINEDFAELAGLLRKLELLKDKICEDIPRDISLQFAHENNESAIFQQATARDVKVLTWVTFHSIPFALVAALLSTRAGFLPLPENPWSLIISLLIMEIIVWVTLMLYRLDMEWTVLSSTVGSFS